MSTLSQDNYCPGHSAAVEAQWQADIDHLHESYTGVAPDAITHDYMAWYRGRILGWGMTEEAAQAIIAEQQIRDLAHPQPEKEGPSARHL